MRDDRKGLKAGTVLVNNAIGYTIKYEIGRGGSSLAYAAEYDDSAVKSGVHRCIIKELFPYHPKNKIYRADDNSIISEDELFFERHRNSFLKGSLLHLEMIYDEPESSGANINSFEENNTVYTILGFDASQSLSGAYEKITDLREIIRVMVCLTDNVSLFHKQGILHLDISPDNIVLSKKLDRVMLIDFNSGARENDGISEDTISVNPGFSAPELKLRRISEICKATDIFSVCAVMVYLISGRFDYSVNVIKQIKDAPALKDIPRTAAAYLYQILQKGLRADPKLRYQTADELKEAFSELLDRIECRGVTHAALWEISRKSAVNKELIDNRARIETGVISSMDVFSISRCVLFGEGGIGKTAMLEKAAYLNTRSYNPNKAVFFTVPLCRCDGERDFIKRYIVSKIRYSAEISTQTEAMRHLTQKMRKGDNFIALLLDGFNEITESKKHIIEEIIELSAYRGVRIIISSRGDIPDIPSDFIRAELLPLARADVRGYLTEAGLAAPENDEVIRLLQNPLMLTLYTRSNIIMRDSAEPSAVCATQQDIIQTYIRSFLSAKRKSAPGDELGYLRLNYALSILFPAICSACRRRSETDFKRMYKICKREYKRLKTKAFSAAFPEFAGRAAELLRGVNDINEWFEIIVNRILINDTALLVCNGGYYRPMHMNFIPYLSENGSGNRRKLLKASAIKHIPLIAAAIAAAAALGYACVYFAPHTHPMGREEIYKNTEAMNAAVMYLAKAENLISNEQSVAKILSEGKSEAAINTINRSEEKISAMNYSETEDLSLYKYYGLDTDAIEKIGDDVREHREFQRDLFERLEAALEPESRYTDAYITNAGEAYTEYLDVFCKYLAYKVYIICEPLNGTGKKAVSDMLSFHPILEDYSEAAALGKAEAEECIKKLESDMKRLRMELEIIQR